MVASWLRIHNSTYLHHSTYTSTVHKPGLIAGGDSTFFNAFPFLIAPNNEPLPPFTEGVGPKII